METVVPIVVLALPIPVAPAAIPIAKSRVASSPRRIKCSGRGSPHCRPVGLIAVVTIEIRRGTVSSILGVRFIDIVIKIVRPAALIILSPWSMSPRLFIAATASARVCSSLSAAWHEDPLD